MWVRGRHGTGAFCPLCNLAREAATLSLVTRIGRAEALIPLGKLHSTGPLLAYAGLVSVASHKVVDTMSQRKRSTQPKRPFRERPAVMTILNPNAAGIDVHADMHMVCVPAQSVDAAAPTEPGGLPAYVRRAAHAIMQCRTAALGGHVQACPDGHMARIWYNSCRHRSCPQCAYLQTERWLAHQQARLLACDHYHVIFTLPHELNPLWLANVPVMTALLFQTVRDTLGTLLADPKYLGAQPGIIAALHTWSQTLVLHPHLHCLNSVRYKFCMRVLRVLRVPKQGVRRGGSPVLGAFLGSPRAHFLVSTWVERPHCLLPPPQKAWEFLLETVRSFRAKIVPDTIGHRLKGGRVADAVIKAGTVPVWSTDVSAIR